VEGEQRGEQEAEDGFQEEEKVVEEEEVEVEVEEEVVDEGKPLMASSELQGSYGATVVRPGPPRSHVSRDLSNGDLPSRRSKSPEPEEEEEPAGPFTRCSITKGVLDLALDNITQHNITRLNLLSCFPSCHWQQQLCCL